MDTDEQGPPSTARRPGRLPRVAPWLALVSIFAVAGVLLLLLPWLERGQAADATRAKTAALLRCLGHPEIDAATLRARAIAADLDGSSWPGSCQAVAAELTVELTRALQTSDRCGDGCCAGDADCEQLAIVQSLVTRIREEIALGRFDSDSVTALAEAAEGWIVAARSSDGPKLSTLALRRASPPALLPGRYDVSALTHTDAGSTLFLHERGKRALTCQLDEAWSAARCHPLAASIPVADELYIVAGASEAPTTLLAREHDGSWSVYRADGARVMTTTDTPLGVAARGQQVALAIQQGQAHLAIASWLDEPIPLATSTLGAPLAFADHVVWPVARDGALLLAGMTLPPDDTAPPEPRVLETGAIAWPSVRVTLRACRHEATRAVLALDDTRPGEAVLFVGGQQLAAWQAHALTLATPLVGLTCHADAAALSWIQEDGSRDEAGGVVSSHRLGIVRCDPKRCSADEAEVELARHSRASRHFFASLGHESLLLWRSPHGDVRMAQAPAGKLATAPPSHVHDDAEHGGFAWDSDGAELLVQDDRALLLVQSNDSAQGARGVHALRLGEGSATRIAPR